MQMQVNKSFISKLAEQKHETKTRSRTGKAHVMYKKHKEAKREIR